MPAASAASEARPLPRLAGYDHTWRFLSDPYRFIGRACRAVDSDVVLVRLMLQPTLCMQGVEAARLFYDKACFTRAGAAPEAARATLFGKGGVQGLDGAAHLQRKRFFLAATAPQRIEALVDIATSCWDELAPQWETEGSFSLYAAMQRLLTRAVCRWAGVPLPGSEEAARTAQLAALFDQAAAGLRAHVRARRARRAAEDWLAGLVERVRKGAAPFPPDSVAAEAALLRGTDARLLPPRIAAVELLNVLRPTVAVSVYVVLCAHALHLHPQWRGPLAHGDAAVMRAFAQEVRRFYPFFPAVAARTARAFTWHGLGFPAGVRVLLDLYGTHHDSRTWYAPDSFRPERFLALEPGLFDLIPQGGARPESHHRCPGEGITLALMQRMLGLLARSRYQLPEQDLQIRMERMPALPASRLQLQAFQAAA